MSELPLPARIERQLAESGLQVVVEVSDGALVLNGIVDTEENRQAALDIASTLAPAWPIENNIELELTLPGTVDEMFRDESLTELPESVEELSETGGELDPDFTDQRLLRDPFAASGAVGSAEDDPAAEGDEVYTPPDDPVTTTDAHGFVHVLGGFGSEEEEDVRVARSAEDNRLGDEAIADAIRQELREDAATTDLEIVVAVRRGVAHLRGQVSDLEDAENAEAVASRVPGVREVVEELEVRNL